MANSNNDVRELEDLLTELEGQGALPVGPYSDEDDAVTQLMDTPLGEQEWMIQITPLDRRMMSTEQLLSELATGTLVKRDMLVWRNGMSDWAPIHRMEELAGSGVIDVPVIPDRAPVLERRPAPLPPPPAPIPPRLSPAPIGSSTLASPGALPPPPSLASSRVPAPSTPFGAPRPLTPVPDAPPPSPLPLLNSAFGPSSVTPVVPPVAPLPELGSAFNVPPPAAAPQPPPPPAMMRTTTQRPVAVDFSEIEPTRPAPMRVLIGSGIAAVAMIVGTVFALSAGGVFESGPESSHVAPEPAASATAAAAKPVEARAEIQPAANKPAAEPSRASDEPQTQPVSAKEELVAAPEPALRGAAKESAAKEEAPKVDAKEEAKEEAKSKAAASDDDEQEEASAPAKTRAERRLARRQKREKASEEERAAAPRRAKVRATAAAATAPQAPAAEAEAAPKATTSDPPGSTFNRQAAKTALDDAAAQARNCRPQGGPSGSGKVQVRYEPTGKVGGVSLLTPMFDNTTTGDCVVMVFRRASIPAFTGSPPVVMSKSFEIP